MLLSTVDDVASGRTQRGLSVIVPLAPAETEWAELVRQLAGLPAGSEVILVAADDTPRPTPEGWPSPLDYRVCRSPAGRARQQNLGASVARGEWLWFLHADSRLRRETVPALQRFIARGEEALGWFTLAFRDDGPRWTALNAAGANWRARWLGLPFGDQGLLLPRHRFQALHGFDEQLACGEDHLLVWAARQAGLPLRHVPAVLETSARKYARHGWLITTLRHWRLTALQAWPAWRASHRSRP
ncbi:TIGR04283 family arsenosugar biosynthesis glycosyltransferase [Rhodanobacter ginsengisoli]|uniref:TIGR04283 family arsenosugar biosynthesis glycosyltransferase n=1 Tax=Rhodanobacter ginsengisoli TaxID=418646 RepID=A0ABW0QKS1_9GAMM